MFALYGLGKGVLKTIKKAGTATKKVAKKTGTAVKKTVVPVVKKQVLQSKPKQKSNVKMALVKPVIPSDKTAVKIAIKKPQVKTAVPLVKVVAKKPLSVKAAKSAANQAANKTLKKASKNIAEKKGQSFTAAPNKNIQDVVQKQIQDFAQKTQPQIFPDVPSTSPQNPVAPSQSENLPANATQEGGLSQNKMLAIAGVGIGLLAFVMIGKKGR